MKNDVVGWWWSSKGHDTSKHLKPIFAEHSNSNICPTKEYAAKQHVAKLSSTTSLLSHSTLLCQQQQEQQQQKRTLATSSNNYSNITKTITNEKSFQCDISSSKHYNNNNNNNINYNDLYTVETVANLRRKTIKSAHCRPHYHHQHHHLYHHHHRQQRHHQHKHVYQRRGGGQGFAARSLCLQSLSVRLCSGDRKAYLMLLLQFTVVVLICSLNIGFVTCANVVKNQRQSTLSLYTDNDNLLDVLDYDDSGNSIGGDESDAIGHYTHTWAVHIPDGDKEDKVNAVARDHGFVNLGKIFGDHYHFAHHKVSKRSLVPALPHQSRLAKDKRVKWSQQQIAKSRQKRDFIRIRPSRTSSSRALSLVDAVPFSDPKWSQMWYLNRGGGLDMNVIPAWKEGITGKGIVVTILDDGLESDHPDIINNYDARASYDVNSHDEDPMPHYDLTDSNRHGTRCAGEVAATANNSICAVGIAFGASVGGVRMLDGDVTDAVEARSLSLNPQHIDIYSASWGPDDDGKTVDGPGELASRAFIEGVTKGRAGKGSIFIWASGNGGRELDNCNCDGYTNSIWTLSISSATEEGHVPWYSEKCSSTLATTYSSGGQAEKQVVTTDLHHSCTVSHTGTSASAPLAAGIAALVLESNQNLTWRDLQHIVVRTAKPANLKDTAWSKNGVGRRVSHSFGYGLMDAAAMVKVARSWKTVPEQQRCEINAPHVDKVIPPKSHITLQQTVKYCSINFLEHVQAKITLTSQRRGDIQLNLISPAGTKVTLLTPRMHDVSRSGFNQWPFMSVHTWGESPHGNWQLEIHNEGRYMGHALLREWSLIFYGTAQPIDPNDPVSVPRNNLADITTPNTSSSSSTTNLYQVYSAQYPRISPNNFGSSLLGMSGKMNGKLPPNKSVYVTNMGGNIANYPLYGSITQTSNGNSNKKAQIKQQQQGYQQISASYGVILGTHNNKNNNNGNSNNNKGSKNNKGKSGENGGGIGISGIGGGGGGGKSNKNNNGGSNGKSSKQKELSTQATLGGGGKNKFYRISQQQSKTYSIKNHQNGSNGNQKSSKLQQSAERLQSYEDKLNRKVIGDLPGSSGVNIGKSIKSSYSKLPVKAPKQIKETSTTISPTISTTFTAIINAITLSSSSSYQPLKERVVTSVALQPNQRITKLFERYEKIQSIFPEFQPYQGNKDRAEQTNSSNKKLNKQTVTEISTGGSAVKPSRENAKKSSPSFVPDQRIMKKQQLLLAAAGVAAEGAGDNASSDGGGNSKSVAGQRKTPHNAQITQWNLIFYGTELPAQPDDPIPVNSEHFSPYGNIMEHNDIEYDSSGQWHNMQQIGESSMMSHDRTNSSCLKATINRECLACAPPTFFFRGRCYDKCPSQTYVIKHNDMVDNISNIVTYQSKDDVDEELQSLERKRRYHYKTLKVNEFNIDRGETTTTENEGFFAPNIMLSCAACDVTCRQCYGPLNSQCSICFPGSQLRRIPYTNDSYCYMFAERSSGNNSHDNHSTVQQNKTNFNFLLPLLYLIPTFITISVIMLLIIYGWNNYLNKRNNSNGEMAATYAYDRVALISNEDDEVEAEMADNETDAGDDYHNQDEIDNKNVKKIVHKTVIKIYTDASEIL
ncbi:furin-like protease 1 isoform 1-T12 [Glossina fuscipes fuscipes]